MKIRYEFVTGEVHEVSVSEELSRNFIDIERNIYNNYRRESRRHNSLEYMEAKGIQFKAKDMEVTVAVEEKLAMESLYKALRKLSFEKKKLINLVFFERKTITSIAKDMGVSEAAIRKTLKRIYKEIKIILK
jgi:RNA polymerase sigma factor (sigma-70 family)